MNKKTKLPQKNPVTTQSAADGSLTEWFTKHISRRQAGKTLAWTAALGMAGLTIYQLTGDSDVEDARDSLELQQKEGWNVGSSEKQLVFAEGVSPYDSQQKTWSAYDPNYLISIYQPRQSQWQPFFVPTLIQSLAQTSLSQQIRPIRTNAMAEDYARAEGLRSLLAGSSNANQTLIIADLPGPSSIAVGAALADTLNLVPVFDNWPHPLGVVRSHETLGAMVYYAHEIEEKRAKLPENAPAMLLLDNRRLTAYTDQDSQFDNRYLAKLPPAAELKSRGVQQVIYLVPDDSQKQELDDINEDLSEWQKQGVNVRMLRLSDFLPSSDPLATNNASGTSTSSTTTTHRHYYYGGSPYSHWWFYNHYAYSQPREVYVMRDGRNVPIPRQTFPPRFEPPSYRPVSRPTMFNASRVGTAPGASGVGKTRPSGFGRTSVRVGSNGRVTGVRSGRSGSYGRSGGGWFGG